MKVLTYMLLFACLLWRVGASQADANRMQVVDSDHGNVLVNEETNTGLVLSIRMPEHKLVVGKECEIAVEIRNTSGKVEVVYMPGLTMQPIFRPDEENVPPAKFGPQYRYGRVAAKDDRFNYVCLVGTDAYCQYYKWTPRSTGEVTFMACYKNITNGATIGMTVWTGEKKAQSGTMRVSK